MTPFSQYVRVLSQIEPFQRIDTNERAGGNRTRTYWTDEETAILREHWNPKEGGNMNKLFKLLPKRTMSAIKVKIQREFLGKTDPRGNCRVKMLE